MTPVAPRAGRPQDRRPDGGGYCHGDPVGEGLEEIRAGRPDVSPVAALSGSLERFKDGEIALQHPALQVFEKKVRPETEAQAPEASPVRASPPRSLKGCDGAEAG